MKLCKEKKIPKSTIILPCDRCGDRITTVGFYLDAKSDQKIHKGFYPDLSIRLCEKCLNEALGVFNND